MKLVGRFLSLIIVLGAVAALCLPADAGAYLYAGKRKKVYCGIALLSSIDPITKLPVTNQGAIDKVVTPVTRPDGTTYYSSVLSTLESLNNMKPVGWTLENPLAHVQNKYDRNYWLIPIASARNLSRVNMLYLPGSGTISLTDEERENLRRFVDGGGTLWIDNVDSTSALTFKLSGPFFINQLGFKAGMGVGGVDVAVSRHHPLVCSPYWLTDVEIINLGMNAAGNGWSRCYCDMGTQGRPTTLPLSFDVLFPIVDASDTSASGALMNRPAVVANTYGSGRVVATANAVGQACILSQPYSLPSLKFAYNIMSYASSWTDLRKDPRHSGASIDTLGANRLVEKWKLEDTTMQPAAPGPGKESAAMIYKNTVFYTAGNTLYALDQNGDTHGGMWPADPNGAVVIWKWEDPGGTGVTLSAPTVATVQNPAQKGGCEPIEAVLVMDSAGKVFVLNAFPMDYRGFVATPVDSIYDFDTEAGASGGSGGPTGDAKWPSPPVYINGWIYALGGQGRIFAHNPCLRKWVEDKGDTQVSFEWHYPNDVTNPLFNAAPKCGPSFGFLKNNYSGAIVGTVFWFTAKDASSKSTGDNNDHIHAVPVSVSMDRVRLRNKNTTNTAGEIYVTYVGHLTAPDPNHTASAIRIFENDGVTPMVLADTDVKMNENMNGTQTFGCIAVKTTEPMPSNPLIYASYSVAYDDKMGPGTPLDQEIEPLTPAPSGSGVGHPATTIPGMPCIGQDNMIFVTGCRAPDSAATTPAGGSILAYRQDYASGNLNTLKWHYFLHSGLGEGEANYLPGLNVQIPGVVQTPAGPMMNPQPSSSPVVSGGKGFVTVTGDGGFPQGALLCLKCEPGVCD